MNMPHQLSFAYPNMPYNPMRNKPFIWLWWTKRTTTACVSTAYAATTLQHGLNNIWLTKLIAQGQPLEMAVRSNNEINGRNTEPPRQSLSYQHWATLSNSKLSTPACRSQSYQHLSHLIEVTAINFDLWASWCRTRTSLRKDIAHTVDDRSTELVQQATWFTFQFCAVFLWHH